MLEEGNGDGSRGPRSRRSLVEEDERVDGACSGRFSIQHIIGEDLKCFRLSAPDHHLCLPDRHHLPNLSLHVHQGMCKCICVSRTAFDARMRRDDYRAQVVQEYERAVIFRLGRIKKGGAQGPGGIFEKGRHNFITRRRRINSIQVCAIQHAIDVIGNLKYQASSSSFPALISALWWT